MEFAFGIRPILFISLVFVSLGVSNETFTQPTLSISKLQGGRTLRFSRSESEGCSYTLSSSDKRKKVLQGKGILIAEGLPQESIATNLPRIRQGTKQSSNLFFVLTELCSELTTNSKAVAVRLKGKARGKSLRKFLSKISRTITESAPSIQLTRVFSDISFSAPVDLAHARDSRLFVVEQGGTISVFDSDTASTKRVFLDLTDVTAASGEMGLFSIAFHPSYASNGFFFVHYTDKNSSETVVERYQVDPSDENQALKASAVEFLRLSQPFANHNGGEMEFGPDGYLYLSLGDGGSGGDPLGNGQDRTTLLGSILRIDVDETSSGKQYSIPPSNPFFENTGGFREEIFAYGARNIWKFSFDAVTGTLWAADVGQGSREEVNTVTNGANLGWNITEGDLCFNPPTDCEMSGLTAPVLDYGRSDGKSITGGFVYRGSKIPGLVGYYVFADFLGGDSAGGVVWAFPITDSSPEKQTLDSRKLFISAFGQDFNNELYVLTFNDGAVYRIDPVD
ncbi:MAG: PQQ-dependent sugar dehydrogenase [Bdellovibrionales bacterium]|nr:PQQ-dependent sugar dehydrogenase [Bdellovibrionales bacterium]